MTEQNPEAAPLAANQSDRNTGIVYVLTNDAMPDYIKIGQTGGDSSKDVLQRMRELSQPTGVPLPFNCEYAAVVDEYIRVEQSLLKDVFGDRRVGNKEFLVDVSPFRVKAVLKLIEIEDVTPGQSDTQEPPGDDVLPRRARADNFRFHMADVPIGAILVWADNPSIQCNVVNDRQVEYDGRVTTISNVAKEIKGWTSARGALYWTYEGDTLQERRDRLETEAND